VAELREYILSDTTGSNDIKRLSRGMTSEMIAAISKIMSNADLIVGAKKSPVVARNNNTLGLAGRFGARLQPNDSRDDAASISAQIYEGLSY
jgi:ethanolamine ammonia-lyase large subunit